MADKYQYFMRDPSSLLQFPRKSYTNENKRTWIVLLLLQATITMPEMLKKLAAVFAAWTGPECKIVTREFDIEEVLEVGEGKDER